MDWLSLSTQGDPLLIDLQSASLGLDDAIAVYDQDGASLVVEKASNLDPRLFWIPPATASYRVRIGDDPLAVGASFDARPYTVRIDICPPDAFEPDDVIAAAKPITVGAPAQSHDLCSGGKDMLALSTANGTPYRIETRLAGANVDTLVRLRNASGTTLATSSNGTGGVDERLDWTAPASGTYYLEVTPEGSTWGFDSGYTISVQ